MASPSIADGGENASVDPAELNRRCQQILARAHQGDWPGRSQAEQKIYRMFLNDEVNKGHLSAATVEILAQLIFDQGLRGVRGSPELMALIERT